MASSSRVVFLFEEVGRSCAQSRARSAWSTPTVGPVKKVRYLAALLISSVFVTILSGCVAAPQAAYERLLAVSDSLVSYTFGEAVAAARLVPKTEIEITVTESDPVFDAGWTRSYCRVLVFGCKPGKRYLVTVQSTCNCLGPMKTALLPYVFAFDNRGTVLGEGPFVIRPYRKRFQRPFHFEGDFELVTGTQKTVYFLVFGDNRDVGSIIGYWGNTSIVYGEDGESYDSVNAEEILSNPEGKVSIRVEERE